MIICSWNINGIKSLLTHDISYLTTLNIDVLLLQEVRTGNVKLLYELASIMKFPYVYYNLSIKTGHAGVAILTRLPSVNQYIPEHILPQEGRILVVEFGGITVVNLYTPYIGQGMVNLAKRTDWEDNILNFLYMLKTGAKKIIVGGDLNVAPTQFDRYRVSPNQPGCSMQEANMFNKLKETLGLRDAFRELHGPEEPGFTWGVHEGKIRIDYFLLDPSNDLKIKQCHPIYNIHMENKGPSVPSDHYPIILELE